MDPNPYSAANQRAWNRSYYQYVNRNVGREDVKNADFEDYAGSAPVVSLPFNRPRRLLFMDAALERLKRKLKWIVSAALMHHRRGRPDLRDQFFRIASRLRQGIKRLRAAIRAIELSFVEPAPQLRDAADWFQEQIGYQQ